ncbi:MAG: 2OG-Fe(II) oxygenase [Rubrivivax sp.]|nr:MAG: 2OG-Fe(II) oxygenase [Rubrivivax sp.]
MEAMQYKQYIAKRRVISFESTPDLPAEFSPLRQKAASWLGCQPRKLVHMLVAEFRPGTPLGWHRDAPHFESIVGISLGSEARMGLRPYAPNAPNATNAQGRSEVIELVLAPRSIYELSGAARWAWQHRVAATPAWRYSITFRTACSSATAARR